MEHSLTPEHESMWEIFDRRMEDETVAATKLAQRLIALPPHDAVAQLLPAIAEMNDNSLQQLWRVFKLLNYNDQLNSERADAAKTRTTQTGSEERPIQQSSAEALIAKLDEKIAERTSAKPSASVPSIEKLEAYNALMGLYNNAMASHNLAGAGDFITKLIEITRETELLIKRDPIDYLRNDLIELLCGVQISAAETYKILDDVAQAQAHYERAIHEAATHGLDHDADQYRLKLAEFLYSRTADFDRALRDLLTVWQEMRRRDPSLARVRVMRLLAETYINIGDNFEANQIIQLLKADLTTLGYAPPDYSDHPKTLEQWIRNADRTTNGPIAFREALFQTLVVYMSIENMRSKSAATSDERDLAFRNVHSLNEMHNELNRRDRAISEQASHLGKSSTGPNAEWLAFQVDLGKVIGQVEQFREGKEGADPQTILPEVERLLERARSLNAGRMVALLQGMQGELLTALERHAEAERIWREAYKASLNAGQMDDALHLLYQIVVRKVTEKDFAATSETCGEAIELIERHRYSVSPAYQQSAFLSKKLEFYFLGVFSAYKLGDFNLMFTRMELTKARASLQQLIHRTTNANPKDLEIEIREVNAELDEADEKSALSLQEKRRTLWDLLTIQRAQSNRQQPPSEFSLSDVQKALKPDEVVVYYYWIQPGVLLVVALDKEKIEVSRELFDGDYQRLVEAIAFLGQMKRAYLSWNDIEGFGQRLLPEFVQAMLRGKKHVIFSPHRILHLFPFHALRWENEYLISRLAVSYAPNLTALLVRYPPNDADSVLAVGIEDFAIAERPLTPLPGAIQEVNDLRSVYTEHKIPTVIFDNANASCEKLRDLADNGKLSLFRTLHFATHGEDLLSDQPMETYLCLYDGLLDGFDIAAWHLNAELVVLSACHSGKRSAKGRGLDELPGDEIFGLQSAFFSAGARRVLGALWPAHDEAVARIMKTFHRQLAMKVEPEFALQEAVIDYLKTVSDPMEQNPYYWAPFFITTIGRQLRSDTAGSN